jgi:hypothetical protein
LFIALLSVSFSRANRFQLAPDRGHQDESRRIDGDRPAVSKAQARDQTVLLPSSTTAFPGSTPTDNNDPSLFPYAAGNIWCRVTFYLWFCGGTCTNLIDGDATARNKKTRPDCSGRA